MPADQTHASPTLSRVNACLKHTNSTQTTETVNFNCRQPADSRHVHNHKHHAHEYCCNHGPSIVLLLVSQLSLRAHHLNSPPLTFSPLANPIPPPRAAPPPGPIPTSSPPPCQSTVAARGPTRQQPPAHAASPSLVLLPTPLQHVHQQHTAQQHDVRGKAQAEYTSTGFIQSLALALQDHQYQDRCRQRLCSMVARSTGPSSRASETQVHSTEQISTGFTQCPAMALQHQHCVTQMLSLLPCLRCRQRLCITRPSSVRITAQSTQHRPIQHLLNTKRCGRSAASKHEKLVQRRDPS